MRVSLLRFIYDFFCISTVKIDTDALNTHTGGSDYIATSGSFTFNNLSQEIFCLDVGIIDDLMIEGAETFLVCASSNQNVFFANDCTTVNITDNEGIIVIINFDDIDINNNLVYTVFEFQFSQLSYNVSEDSGVINVCLELISGALVEDVFIEVTAAANLEEANGRKTLKKNHKLNWIGILDIPIAVMVKGTNLSDFSGISNFVFVAGTQPFSPESVLCLNISIIDDEVAELEERFLICGCSTQTGVVLLNDGCTNIYVEDNDGIEPINVTTHNKL